MTCLKKALIGHDDALAFISAQIAEFTKTLCVGQLNEKKYIREFHQLEMDSFKQLTKFFNLSLDALED